MVKLLDDYVTNKAAFEKAGITVPTYDAAKTSAETKKAPVWLHFGGGNLFRCFHAMIAQKLLDAGELDAGVLVGETWDDAVVKDIYKKYDDRILSVVMKADGTLDKTLLASVGDAEYFNRDNPAGFEAITAAFKSKSLQFVTFSITEKGYALTDMNGNLTAQAQADIKGGPDKAATNMGLMAYLLYTRFQNGAYPIAMVSTDNFSENGQKLENAVLTIAKGWLENGLVDQKFVDYLSDPKQVSFPWSMIDRITPNPSEKVSQQLAADGFEDTDILHTAKHTNIAPFGNTEEVHYLVIEDSFPNGRPALDKAGVILTDRDTVNDADQMKVTACLNPLHTSLAIFGCLLRYQSIAEEVADPDLLNLIKNLGYGEDLPVVVDPKIIDPKQFIDQLIQKRLPNKNIPDTPQRIATDTSQKLPIRYGVTIQHYIDDPSRDPKDLEFIPLILAGWCRYLTGIADDGASFELSNDPLLDQLQPRFKNVQLGADIDAHEILQPILANKSIFAHDLYAIGLGEKVEAYFKQMLQAKGSVRGTIQAALKAHGKNY
ncbi:mannitol dehydrogenase family protein [Agrilactobacillus fermenti]|uniref:mannitol dehydrogenase family protein n=1 Tax=Agrilactobacillus fermenti TaxID=2586909 RepID=UPI003A5C503A